MNETFGSTRPRYDAAGPAFGRFLFGRLPRRAYVLRVLAVPLAWPLFLSLLAGSGGGFLGLAGAMALLLVGARWIDRGLAGAEGQAESVRLVGQSLPPRLAGSLAVGLAAFLVSLGAAHDHGLMALVFGALGFAGAALTYGLEAGLDGAALAGAVRKAAGRGDEVTAALDEARRKIADIETSAAALHSRELKGRLARIVGQARGVLALIERKPGDINRARRFFVTYLDGTRDVVRRYAAQQQDIADTPLAENFRRVLTTIEQVFAEQQELLRRDDKLDLEVTLEVLESQLRREGVH